ncbi:MAG: hypothetical protein JKY32_13495 [Rhizobiales bacterium]|nr:hypothetical protein [Hyphomicrobiales bacterium]
MKISNTPNSIKTGKFRIAGVMAFSIMLCAIPQSADANEGGGGVGYYDADPSAAVRGTAAALRNTVDDEGVLFDYLGGIFANLFGNPD